MLLRNKKLVRVILGILFFLNIPSWIIVWGLNKPQFLEVNFFDVGQGDAIFIVSPQSQQILIDGGPDSTILEKLAEEMPFWDRTIDLIILTHPEKDHITGLIEVLKRYKVENILWTGTVRDTSEYREWIKLIKEEKAKIKIARAGQKIKLSRFYADFIEHARPCRHRGPSMDSPSGASKSDKFIYFDVLYPFDELSGQEIKNSNDTSIVTRLVFKNIGFLFMGDTSSRVEKKLILANIELESEVLKIGHHGSKYSTGEHFLESVFPKLAVIQVGKNSYGHPAPEVLEKLKKFGIKTLRTDINGDIKIISDGKNLVIK